LNGLLGQHHLGPRRKKEWRKKKNGKKGERERGRKKGKGKREI